MEQFSRRTMIAASFGVAALNAIGGTALAAAKRAFFEQGTRPIGLQIYTLGEDAGRDIDATFAQVAAIGYREIELPNLYSRSAATIRAAADKAGLKITSIHIAPQGSGSGSLNGVPAEIAEMVTTLGASRAVVPIAPFPQGFRVQSGETMQAAIARAFSAAGPDHWQRTAATLNERAAALKSLGVSLGYHNHNIEFAPVGRTTGWDILVRQTDPKLVEFEVDTGWVATAGLDPVRFLRGLRGRATQLHIKDVAAGNFVNFGLAMKPAEVGSGTLDWARILPAAKAAGVRHYYVEQEPPFAIPRIEAARKSYGYLSALRV